MTMGVNEAVHTYRSDAGSIPAASTNFIMVVLQEFKVRFCDPLIAYLVGTAVATSAWFAKALFDVKRCRIDGCDRWVHRNELYCDNSHKQY